MGPIQFNLTTILLVAGGILAGWLFGLLDRAVTGRMRKRRQEAQQVKDQAAAEGGTPPAPAPLPDAGQPDQLRLWQDAKKQLRLEIDGRLLSTSEMTPELRRRLIDLLMVVRPWVESGPAAPAATPATAPSPSQPATARINIKIPDEKPKLDMARGVRTFLEGAVIQKEPEPAPLSIVAQIDKVLQRRLAGTPLGGRGVQLLDGEIGQVLVQVGNERYDGIDAVPDKEVQAAIRAAVKEWEQVGSSE